MRYIKLKIDRLVKLYQKINYKYIELKVKFYSLL